MAQIAPVHPSEEAQQWTAWTAQPDPRRILSEVDPEIF